METNLRIAEINLARQLVAYDALVAPAREADIRVAEAALTAAQAGVNAAFDTGTDAYDREIARLQTELARNALWQQQLHRDQAMTPQIPEGFPEHRVPRVSLDQERQLEAGLAQADFGVLIADASYESTAGRGPDAGSLGAANASVVAAELQLSRLLDGPSDMDLARSEIQLKQAQLARDLAQVNLDRARLYAPFDGVVAVVNLTQGELPPTATAVEIIDNSVFYIDLAIDETEIVDVQVGQPVSLVLDALPEAQITGTITRVAQTPTRIGQVVTYIARVALDPTLEPVRLGMNATATIKVQQLQDVFTLRNRFIRIDRATQQAYVTVQREDGLFEEIEVQLGLRNETHSQVISGLEAGQRVVLLPRGELNVFAEGG
jgi:HlyD family secretion protein